MNHYLRSVWFSSIQSKGFTLPELLIGVSISAILLTGILAFLGNGIGNAWNLKKQVEQAVSSNGFDRWIAEIQMNSPASLLHSGSYTGAGYGSGILLFQSGARLPLSFIAEKSITGYCDTASGAVSADGNISKLSLLQTESPDETFDTGLSASGNIIYSGSMALIGKINPLTATTSSFPANPSQVSLLHPKSAIFKGNIIFVADTGNDRVLAYSGGLIYEVIGATEWIPHPRMLRINGETLEIYGELGQKISIRDAGSCNYSIPQTLSVTVPNAFSTLTISGGPGVSLSSETGAYLANGTAADSVTVNTTSITANFSASIPTGTSLSFSGITITSWSNPYYYLTAQFDSITKSFPIIICGDNNILTSTGNVIENTSMGGNYPIFSGLYNFTTFTGNISASETSLSPYPISDFTWSSDGKILTLSYLEYTNYDCKLTSHERRERIIKIPLSY